MMPKARQIDVVQLLAAVNIVDVIDAHVPLKKKGTSYFGLCPFHDEKTPSFHVNPARQFYHCFGCGASGDAIDFVRDFHRLDFKAACEWLAGGRIFHADPSEVEAAKARRAGIEREAAEQQARIHDEIALKAQRLWNRAHPAASQHPYLVKKGVKGYGLRQLRNMLLIPACRADGTLRQLQFIQPDGGKTFLTGGEVKSCYAACGKAADVICIAEGLATRDSVFEATSHACVAAFFAGNLLPVAQALRAKFPAARLILVADNDQWKDDGNNPGVTAAREAAAAVGGWVAIPIFSAEQLAGFEQANGGKPTDFNDLMQIAGMDEVRRQIAEVVECANSASADPEFVDPVILESGGSPKKPPVKGSKKPKGRENVVDFPQKSGSERHDEMDVEADDLARQKWEKRIHDTDNFNQLVYVLYPEIAASSLRVLTKLTLGKLIAKKTKIGFSELKNQTSRTSPSDRYNAGENSESDRIIDELNQRHAVVPIGGGVYIVNRDFDPGLNRNLLSFSSEAHFILRYCNQKIWNNGALVSIGEYWLEHPRRKTYEGMVFSPDQEVPDYLNLWQGWGCEPREGDCSLWLDFAHQIICNGDDELFGYVMMYFAHMVQKPRELPETSLVLRGEQGIGKNTFFDAISSIVGKTHCIMLTSLNQIAGRFAGHLTDVIFVVCNEGVWGGNKDGHGILKSMITDDYQPMEKKGKDIVTVRNFKRILFSTNAQWAVPRDMDDRRHVILDVSNARKGDFDYWAAIRQQMANGGVPALFHKLLNIELDDWHPRLIPERMKEQGWEMKIMGANSVERWWMECLMRQWVFKSQAFAETAVCEWPEIIQIDLIQSAYLHWCAEYKIMHPEHPAVMGKYLKEFGVFKVRPRANNSNRQCCYKFPTIESAQAIFCKKFRLPDSFWEEDHCEEENLKAS
jgi:phage/plasmid primase-like uncharacterized protein